MPHTLLIATGNAGKVKEIRHEMERATAAAQNSFLATLQILGLKDLPTPPPECIEDHSTFEGNAQKKARHYAAFSGMLTLADDSGLCVDALGGAPGVYSARYAGITGPTADAANNAKLMQATEHVRNENRQAQFVCAMALALPHSTSQAHGLHAMGAHRPPPHEQLPDQDKPFHIAPSDLHLHACDLALTRGEVHGILLRHPRGTNGFGYDPYFFFPEFNKTTAELDLTAKSQISHRGKALRQMIAWMHEHADQLSH